VAAWVQIEVCMKILRLVPIVFASGAVLVALPALALPAPISLPAPSSGNRDDGVEPEAPPCGDDDDDGDDEGDDDDDDSGELPART
jgi:hypothetical protein